MKLNPNKYTFGVESKKFLGYIGNQRGIEANPNKIRAPIEKKSPRWVKEFQSIIKWVTTLSRLVSSKRQTNAYLSSIFELSDECNAAFLGLNS